MQFHTYLLQIVANIGKLGHDFTHHSVRFVNPRQPLFILRRLRAIGITLPLPAFPGFPVSVPLLLLPPPLLLLFPPSALPSAALLFAAPPPPGRAVGVGGGFGFGFGFGFGWCGGRSGGVM